MDWTAEQPFAFSVLKQRSMALTGQYWNPILMYVSRESGVPLEPKLEKMTKEGNALAEQRAYGFLYSAFLYAGPRSARLSSDRAVREAHRLRWNSEVCNELCVMVGSNVPRDKVVAVREAFVDMTNDLDGRRVLEAGAELLKTNEKFAFIAADNRDYDNYRAFYKSTAGKVRN